MNRKGHVPTILLFVAGVILALVAWSTFLSFNDNFDGKSRDFSGLVREIELARTYISVVLEDSINEAVEELDFSSEVSEEEFRNKFREIVDERDLQLSQAGNFFGIIRTGDYELSMMDEEENELVVKDIFLRASGGNHEVKEEGFSLSVKFDDQGVISLEEGEESDLEDEEDDDSGLI